MVLQADDVVHLLAHDRQGFRRRDRHRENELLRFAQTGRAQRRAGGGAGGDAVVDDERDTIRDVDAFTVTQIESPPTLDFGEFIVTGRTELGVTDACQHDDVFIAHDEAAIDHRTHGQLEVRRDADLALDQIERGVRHGRDLGRHRNAAARQRKDHGLPILIVAEQPGRAWCRPPLGP